MRRFSIIFKQFIQYYIYFLILLGVLSIIIPKPFILGLIIGTVGSLINTYIFELYLSRQSNQITYIFLRQYLEVLSRYHCVRNMVLLKDYVNIIGVMIGLMFLCFNHTTLSTAKELKF